MMMKQVPEINSQVIQRTLNSRTPPLSTGGTTSMIYTRMNTHQRALLRHIWLYFRDYAHMGFEWRQRRQELLETLRSFLTSDFISGQQSRLLPSVSMWPPSPVAIEFFFNGLLNSAFVHLSNYAAQFLNSGGLGFVYTVTHHLLLSLNENEMGFIRHDDCQKSFEVFMPEADFGPVGPGPAFHIGQTEPSISGLDYGKLASLHGNKIERDQLGSIIAQDGNSMMHLCQQSPERSSSIPSDNFNDSEMSGEYADDEYAVLAGHQVGGQIFARTVEEDEDEMDVFVSEEGNDVLSDHSTNQMDLNDVYEDYKIAFQ